MKTGRWAALSVALLFAIATPAQQPTLAERSAQLRGLSGQGEEAIRVYREALEDEEPRTRSLAIDLLAKEAGTASVEWIGVMVKDPNENVAVTAVRALKKIGGEATDAPLREALKSENPRVRGQTLAYIGDSQNARLLDDVGARLADSNPGVQVAAVQTLRALGDPAAAKYLMPATSSSNIAVQVEALTTLAVLHWDAVLPRAVVLAAAESPRVRASVAQVIVILGATEQELETIDKLAADKEPLVARALLVSLAEHPSPAALPAMRKLASAETNGVRAGAVRALSRLEGDGATAVLIERARQESDVRIRAAAVATLGRRNSDEALAVAGKAAGDEEVQIRASAAIALGEGGRQESIPLLAKLSTDTDLTVRLNAIDAMGLVGGPAAIEPLRRALSDPLMMVQLSALRALGTADIEGTRKDIRAALEHSDLTVQLEAIRQLGRLRDRASIPALRELSQATAEELRHAARKALDEIGPAPAGD